MAVGIAVGQANAILDALCTSAAYADPAAFCVQLHTASPGVAGTTAIATETTRKAATMAAASSGSTSNSADITWTSVLGSETYSHVSFWSATTAGTFLGSDDLATPVAVVAGNNFTISAGQLVVAITVLAA